MTSTALSSPPDELADDIARQKAALASEVFVPASPISVVSLFAGRTHQINKVFDAINQPGVHAVIFGDRGVGKTSLANIIAPFSATIGKDLLAQRVNCDAADTFSSVWSKALRLISVTQSAPGIGFTTPSAQTIQPLSASLPEEIKPFDLFLALRQLGVKCVFIFDEFDRLSAVVRAQFTDLIKAFSDHAIPATIIIVGVADTVDALVRDHASIERALLQIPMPRMSAAELQQIIAKGSDKLEMTFRPNIINSIVRLSQGLPHYTHLLALHSVRSALGRRSSMVEMEDFQTGLSDAVENTQQTISSAHHVATASARDDALFSEVLLACALAHKDQRGRFRAKDVEEPLTRILGRAYKTAAFAGHLKQFCQADRGSVLVRTGQERKYRYHFQNPLFEPFVLMKGAAMGVIDPASLHAA